MKKLSTLQAGTHWRLFLRRVEPQQRVPRHLGVRPLCYLKSEISVPIPREDDEEEQAARREEMKLEAVAAIMSALNDYPTYLWGDALAETVSTLFRAKPDVEEIAQEEADKKAAEG